MDSERGRARRKSGRRLSGRTVLVVNCDGIRSPVALFVLRDHHGDGERLETVTW